jgi:hypothetical protein
MHYSITQLISIFFCLELVIPCFAGTPECSYVSRHGSSGFIENKGQFTDEHAHKREDLRYLFVGEGLKVQVMDDKLSFELFHLQYNQLPFDEAFGLRHSEPASEEPDDSKLFYKSSRVDVEFLGANADPEIIAEEMLPDYLNYYLTYAPSAVATHVRQFKKITYKNLYDHIDMVLIAVPDPRGTIVYDFVIHPGGNVADIRYRYRGQQAQHLNEQGILITTAPEGILSEQITSSYLLNGAEANIPVDVFFNLKDGVIQFSTAPYDQSKTLVIDPLLVWATYCGGTGDDEGRGLGTDSLGNVVLTGRTNSTTNIATAGAFQTTISGNLDIFLEKYDSSGNRLWGTYYGGTGDDRARALVADGLNNYYLGGQTNSDGLATEGAYREHYAGGTGDDGLLAYFTAEGFRVFATYYGGTDDETMRRMSIDHNGDVLLVGHTSSDSGIATAGTYQTIFKGAADLCLSKWSPNGQLIWGSYLGGSSEDHGRSVTVDKDNFIYVNGSTGSDSLATPGVSRTTRADGQDYLLGKFTPDGQIVWISYWGGDEEDRGRGVFVDSSSKYVYFTGYSASDTGIATPGAYQQTLTPGYDDNGDPYHDIVLMKWTVDGQIVWATYLGDTLDDRGRAITMVGDNEIYVSGSTESPGVIATPDGFQTVWGGHGDMFLEIFDSNGIRHYGTYFGGTGDEDDLALAIDHTHHNIYLAGSASSQNLATPGVAQTVFGGFKDAFLVKIRLHTETELTTASFTYSNVPCSNNIVQFENNSTAADTYLWDFGDGTTSTEFSPSHHYASAGNYLVTLAASNSSSGDEDTAQSTVNAIQYLPVAGISVNGSTTVCEGVPLVLKASSGNNYTYQWMRNGVNINGATNQKFNATTSGSYTVAVANACGNDTSDAVDVTVNKNPKAIVTPSGTIAMCAGDDTLLIANEGPSQIYQWLLNGSAIAGATQSTYIASAAGKYSVQVTKSTTGCSKTSATTKIKIVCKTGADAELPFICYPNPSADIFYLTYDGSLPLRAMLFDVAGRKLMDIEHITGTIEFGENLSAGIYLLQVTQGNQAPEVIKLSKVLQ